MLITCPYCGPRDVSEFSYQGDANRMRPDPASTDQAAWNAYVYDRVNTAGDHNEYWQHAGGCRAHLAVTRNTLTHEITSVAFARDMHGPDAAARPRKAGGRAMSPRRSQSTGRIDRGRTIRFTFDGTAYTGHAGDTLASALLATGVTLFGRSFKYHRPRGVLAAGIDEPNALVTVLSGDVREPNIPATMLEIYDGLVAVSQNRFPRSPSTSARSTSLAGKALSAGFYYKTFMGPVVGPLKGTRFWMFCEHFIRRAAGLGRAGTAPDTSRYERMNAFCDVLVVGSGPAGLMAARSAAESGARVILAELDPRLGGSANWSDETIDGTPAPEWAAETVARTRRRWTMSVSCPAPPSGAITTTTRWPRSSASPTTWRRRPRARRATATG